jgi:hypothetical protein
MEVKLEGVLEALLKIQKDQETRRGRAAEDQRRSEENDSQGAAAE